MPKSIVLDSSVVVKWLNKDNEPNFSQAQKILIDLESNKIQVYLPELVKYEVGNALLYKKLLLPQAKANLTPLYLLPISWEVETPNQSELTLSYAAQYKITYYDACFLSLTKLLSAELITANPKHQKISGLRVIRLEDYH